MHDDDPVVAEHDVYISTQLSSYLHIFQLPGNYEELEAQNPTTSATGRYKRLHKLVELETVLDTQHATYCEERGFELAEQSLAGRIKLNSSVHGDVADERGKKLASLKLAGSRIALNPHNRFFVATCIDNAIHLTPVETMIAMKPALGYLDEADAKTKTISKKLDIEPNAQEKLKAVQVQFKKRETEEQMAARLSSFAYLQRQVDDEPWVPLVHFLPGTNESTTVAQRLAAASSAPIEML